MAVASGYVDETLPRLRQSFDLPGQHLNLQRAAAEPAFPAGPKRKDHAGVGHRQGEAIAEGDAHHAILQEGVNPLRRRLILGLNIKFVAQTARTVKFFLLCIRVFLFK